jgi:hypothetical protein
LKIHQALENEATVCKETPDKSNEMYQHNSQHVYQQLDAILRLASDHLIAKPVSYGIRPH